MTDEEKCKIQITKWRQDITNDLREIKRLLKEHNEQLNANILNNLNEMDKFLGTNYQNLPKNRKSEYP